MRLRSEGVPAVAPFRPGGNFSREALTDGLGRLSQRVLELARGERLWIEKICAGLLACLEFLDEEPQLAGQLMRDERPSSLGAVECTGRLEAALCEVLERARSRVIVGCELMASAALLAELVVSGALSLAHAHVQKERPLIELAPALMAYIVAPYLGAGAAQLDGDQSTLAAQAEVVPIRPTPGTLGVLHALDEAPQLTCSELRLAAGLRSMDRTREIVRRLRQRGLIESTKKGRAAGALRLTPYGRRILELADQRPEQVAA